MGVETKVRAEVDEELTNERVIRDEIEGEKWLLISRPKSPSSEDSSQSEDSISNDGFTVYRCGNFMIHVPKRDIDLPVLDAFGKRLVPTTKLERVPFTEESGDIKVAQTVYVQDRVEPLLFWDWEYVMKGEREVEKGDGVIHSLFINEDEALDEEEREEIGEEREAIIIDLCELIKDSIRCGIWMRDITIIMNVGVGSGGKLYYFDLGDFGSNLFHFKEEENWKIYLLSIKVQIIKVLKDVGVKKEFRGYVWDLLERELPETIFAELANTEEKRKVRPAGEELRQKRIDEELARRLAENESGSNLPVFPSPDVSVLAKESLFENYGKKKGRFAFVKKWFADRFSDETLSERAESEERRFLAKKGRYVTKEEVKAYSLLFAIFFVPLRFFVDPVRYGIDAIGVSLGLYFNSLVPVVICFIISHIVSSCMLLACVYYYQYKFRNGKYKHINFNIIKILQFSPMFSNLLMGPLQMAWNGFSRRRALRFESRGLDEDSLIVCKSA